MKMFEIDKQTKMKTPAFSSDFADCEFNLVYYGGNFAKFAE